MDRLPPPHQPHRTPTLPLRGQPHQIPPPARPKPLREGAPSVLFSSNKGFRKAVSLLPGTQKSNDSSKKTVEINITLPSFSPFRLLKKLLKIPIKGWLLIGAVCVSSYLGYTYVYKPTHASQAIGAPGVTTTNIQAKPEFDTILPGDKTIDELGGWKRVSPPDRDPVFAYADTVSGMQIIVSEQPLPKSFEDDISGKVAKLAEDFHATQKVTMGDTTTYIGTSSEGPQSAILAKNNLLILIKSAVKLTTNQWVGYINSLH
jgi:hypothetical protein